MAVTPYHHHSLEVAFVKLNKLSQQQHLAYVKRDAVELLVTFSVEVVGLQRASNENKSFSIRMYL